MDPIASVPSNAAVSLVMPQAIPVAPAHAPRWAPLPAPRIDAVSVADVLRNGFVYPPHSIFEGQDMASLSANLAGRDPQGSTAYGFRWRDSGKRHDAKATPSKHW